MILTGLDAFRRLVKYIQIGSPYVGKQFAYDGNRLTFHSGSWLTMTFNCQSAYFWNAIGPNRVPQITSIDLRHPGRLKYETLRLYTQDFPLPEDCSGAVNGSSHKPEIGENTMSRNTTKRLFQIANFNLGSTVKKQGVEFLVAGFRGFYQNARISTYSSDDVTSVPPTDNPTIEYQLLGRDGRTVVARKSDITLVLSNRGIHEKLALGTAVAFGSAKDDLEDLKSEWTRVRRVAPAPAPSWTAPVPVAPAADVKYVNVKNGTDTHTLGYSSIDELIEKLEALV